MLIALICKQSILNRHRETSRRNFIGGLASGINFPKERKKPIIDLTDCKDVIIVDRHYFLNNLVSIQAWALYED
jgi:hypothetical protein